MLNKLKKLTFRRLRNILKVYFSYLLSIVSKNPKRYGYPITLSVEPTTACNLSCVQCPVGMKKLTRPPGNIKFELFKKIVDESASHVSAMILYFQGEPYLNKEFFKCIEYASKTKNIYTISSTNGHFISDYTANKTLDSGLDELIISLDGINQKSYEKYRKNGNVDLVMKGIENLARLRKKHKTSKLKIIVQCLALSSNLHDIKAIKKFALKAGADKFELKKAQFYNFKEGHELMPDTIDKSRYKKTADGNWQLKKNLKNRCRRLWETAVITWDGELLPCCYDKNAEHSFGNINALSFREINNNQNALSFRKQLLQNRKAINICTNCNE